MKAVDVVRRAANNKLLLAKKNSPHIFFGLGVVGVLGATVLACKATLKLEEKLHVFKEEIDEVKEEFTHD